MSQEQCLHLAREMRTITSLVTLSLGSSSRRVLASSSNPEVYTALESLAHLPRLRDVALFGLKVVAGWAVAWRGRGLGVARVWPRCGSGLAQAWRRLGAGFVHVWLKCSMFGSGQAQA